MEYGQILASFGSDFKSLYQLLVRRLVIAAAIPGNSADTQLRPNLHWYDLDRQRGGLDLSKVGRETLIQGPDQDYRRRRVKIGKGREGRKSECHVVTFNAREEVLSIEKLGATC